MNAQLHVLSGEQTVAIARLYPYMSPSQQARLLRNRPELMGVIPLLPAVLPAVTWGAKAIWSGITGAKADKKAKAEQSRQDQLIREQMALQERQATQKAQTMKYLIFGGIGVVALVAVIGTSRRRRR